MSALDRIRQRQLEHARIMRIEVECARDRVNGWAETIAASTDEEIVEMCWATVPPVTGQSVTSCLTTPIIAAERHERAIADLNYARSVLLESDQDRGAT